MSDSGAVVLEVSSSRLANNDLWDYFIDHPDLAAKVLALTIEDDGDWWDRHSSEEDSEEDRTSTTEPLASRYRLEAEKSEQLLLEALSHMTALESFTWESTVPLINQGEEIRGNVEGCICQEDVWTTLRDTTSLNKLKVIDWGRFRSVTIDPRPIWESAFFTLRNLTYLNLRIVYSPFNPEEGTHIDDRDDFDLIPGRVQIERLNDLLRRCPNLESLSLEIDDREFYDLGGNPYTNITSIVSCNFWPHLHTLHLRDILVDKVKMGDFLFNHRGLTHISAILSLPADDRLPTVPFDVPYFRTTPNILPNLESLYLPTHCLRRVLYYIQRPSPLHRLGILEPTDWYADEEMEEDENYVHSLDDVWGELDHDPEHPEPRTPESPRGSPQPPEPPVLRNYLVGIRNIRSVVVRDVARFMQLSRLIRATRYLESVVFLGEFINELHDHASPHLEVLPYLSRWENLSRIKGCIFWPKNKGFDLESQDVRNIAQQILEACPNLRLISYSGHTIRLSKGESGEVNIEWEEENASNDEDDLDLWW